MRQGSLRARILTAAAFWSVGLFIAGLILSTAIMLHNRQYAFLLHGFVDNHQAIAIPLVLVCLFFGIRFVRSGLSPLVRLRARLGEVHAGLEGRVSGRYPSEVQPLVDDLNALLAHREEAVRRAIAKAGDLAHGLKTPLAVLAHEADRARACGHHELAETLATQVGRMLRQIDYHLAHARAAAAGAAGGTRCGVRESVDALARTLERLHQARAISIETRVDPSHTVVVQREDLDEMLGNLLDNACKWAHGRVSVSSVVDGDVVEIHVDDDGSGVEPGKRDAVLQRGVRADEAAPGSGLGLAIVRDLAELYGGSITLESAPMGGLRARLRLPAAAGPR